MLSVHFKTGKEAWGCGKGIWGHLDLQSTLPIGLSQKTTPPTPAGGVPSGRGEAPPSPAHFSGVSHLLSGPFGFCISNSSPDLTVTILNFASLPGFTLTQTCHPIPDSRAKTQNEIGLGWCHSISMTTGSWFVIETRSDRSVEGSGPGVLWKEKARSTSASDNPLVGVST